MYIGLYSSLLTVAKYLIFSFVRLSNNLYFYIVTYFKSIHNLKLLCLLLRTLARACFDKWTT